MIIVGAGLAGLRVGLETLRKKPSTRICIVEQYGAAGGRMYTARQGWEIGAGRIATTHAKVLHLLHHYGLHTVPISNTEYQVTETGLVENSFESLITTWIQPLTSLGPDTLGNHTLYQLLTKIHGQSLTRSFASLFPYWSELHTLRADLAIQSFQAEFGSKASFVVCAEGLQTIAKKMAADFVDLGGNIKFNTTVTAVRDGTVFVKGGASLTASRIVLALHADALRALSPVKIPALRHLKMEPLVRMYAVFPGNPVWYKDLPKLVTPGPLRYVIPVKNAIMISYTDGADAAYWIKKPKGVAQREVMAAIRALLPTHTIPDPLEFHIYPWPSGCTYWLPGSYDPAQMIRESLQLGGGPQAGPSHGGLYACGESLSLKQAWMEGALDSADDLLRIL